jgi:hypothetical protein
LENIFITQALTILTVATKNSLPHTEEFFPSLTARCVFGRLTHDSNCRDFAALLPHTPCSLLLRCWVFVKRWREGEGKWWWNERSFWNVHEVELCCERLKNFRNYWFFETNGASQQMALKTVVWKISKSTLRWRKKLKDDKTQKRPVRIERFFSYFSLFFNFSNKKDFSFHKLNKFSSLC